MVYRRVAGEQNQDGIALASSPYAVKAPVELNDEMMND